MKRFLKRIYRYMRFIGVDPYHLFSNIRGILTFFIKDYFTIKKQIDSSGSSFKIKKLYPCLNDKYTNAGTCKGAYFHHDLLVAQKIFFNNPKTHLDIGSRIDGFVAHVASFRKIDVLDIRKLESKQKNIIFKQADIMLPCEHLHNAYDSVSSLSAIEHFGLGRYGDPIDINGSEKSIENIYKTLKTNGIFYFAVPIGEQRIEFNAHRVFSISYLLNIFKGKFEIISFSYVNDAGDLYENVDLPHESIQNNFGCVYGFAIFELRKLPDRV